jgi:single-stranded-DNA-specific exonuclease
MKRVEHRAPVPAAAGWQWPHDTHPVLRQVYARRGIGSPAELELELKRLRPVGEFASLDRAVDLLLEHRESRIVIFGDYDADGATSMALMVLCLRDLGFERVDYFVPDRFELGYGLTPEAVAIMAERKPRLIVTVDNGVASVAGVEAAAALGIDVLVTDHHLPGDTLPGARVIVNPNLPGDSFGGKHLAGVGVAFYVLAALGRALGHAGAVARYTDLVALGTMADVVPLDHSNRILINEGLRRIRAGRCRPGLRALCSVSGVAPGTLRSSSLAYQIAPRLNAAGRLDDMSIGVRCLVCDSDQEALALATRLDELNRRRRDIESQMRAEALELVAAETPGAGDLPPVICLYRDAWHEGVVGIVASRIKDRYHRPVVAFARSSGELLKGSARSIAGFHIRDALAAVDAAAPGLIVRYGGHAMAAGLTLRADRLDAFTQALRHVGAQRLDADLLADRILTDGALPSEHRTLEVAELLHRAGPWGQGFPEPSFDDLFVVAERRVVGQGHLKLKVREPVGDSTIPAIAFGQGGFDCAPGDSVRLVYRLDVDDYGPRPTVQLVVEHLVAVTGP